MPEITLEVPPVDRTEEVVYAYCQQKRNRMMELRPNLDWTPAKETGEYISSSYSLTAYGNPTIIENIPRDMFELMDSDRFYQLFSPDDYYTEITLYGDDISPLIDLFWDVEPALIRSEDLMFDPELIVRTSLIHLCEFAIEYGHGVGLSQ